MTKGAYLIFLEVKDKEISVLIGKLGLLTFTRGIYCYVGSALGKGSTSLEKRVLRHVKSAFLPITDKTRPKKHWHIDYLLSDCNVIIKKIMLIPSNYKEECFIVEDLTKLADSSVKRFGCSDCKCSSHLLFFSQNNHNIQVYN